MLRTSTIITFITFIFCIPVIPIALAVSVDKPELPCLECHEQEIGVHRVIGVGDFGCQVCHDGFIMKPHMLNGTIVTDETVSGLCQGCHDELYSDWTMDIHGTHGLNYSPTIEIKSCITCHDPHVPDLPEITTLPPPEPPHRSEIVLDIWLPPAFILFTGLVFVTLGFSKKNGGV